MVPRFGPPGDIGFCSGGDGPGVAPAEAFVPVGGTVTFAVRLASAAPQTITATILVVAGS